MTSKGLQATELGEWSIARHAFESGLRCSPQHFVIQNKLLEVLLKLADWQSVPFVVELMLRQIPENVRAVRVHAAVQKQLQPVQLTQSDTFSASHLEHVSDLDQLQPQLKRRRSSAVDSITQQIPIEHHIIVRTLTWQAVTKSLSQFMKHAVNTGLPGGCKVVFLLLDTDSQVCDTDMVSSPPAADQAATGSLPEPENPGDAADLEVSQRLQQGDEQESRPKAAAVPVAAPQRASRRLGFSRYTVHDTEAICTSQLPSLLRHTVACGCARVSNLILVPCKGISHAWQKSAVSADTQWWICCSGQRPKQCLIMNHQSLQRM